MLSETEYLLVQAMSECNEVAHRLSKAIHFGLEEIQPGQDKTNAQRALEEIFDLCATLEMLRERRILVPGPYDDNMKFIEAKKGRVLKFMNYSRSLGITEAKEARP